MSTKETFHRKVSEIVAKDAAYAAPAYGFVADAVSFTCRKLAEEQGEVTRHIRGQELLPGIRDYALEQFGPLALDVLADWGVSRTEDFGEIVFRMVENGLLGATKEDSKEDFANGFDFRQTFLKPYAPPATAPAPLPPID